MPTTFPKSQKSYALLVTSATTLQKVQTIAAAIKRADPDNLVIWSVAPFDVTTTPAWPDMHDVLKTLAPKAFVTEVVTQQEVDTYSDQFTVIS